jgi:hypothetical protein
MIRDSLHYLGEWRDGIGVSLVLVTTKRRLDAALNAMPRLLPRTLRFHIVVCPTFVPALQTLRPGARLGFAFATLDEDGFSTEPGLARCAQMLVSPHTIIPSATLNFVGAVLSRLHRRLPRSGWHQSTFTNCRCSIRLGSHTSNTSRSTLRTTDLGSHCSYVE